MLKIVKAINNFNLFLSIICFASVLITPSWAGPHNPILWQLHIGKTPVTVYFPEEYFPWGQSFPKSRLMSS